MSDQPRVTTVRQGMIFLADGRSFQIEELASILLQIATTVESAPHFVEANRRSSEWDDHAGNLVGGSYALTDFLAQATIHELPS